MPTVVTKTVKPSGGDYSSLAAAISGEAADLVAADVQLDIACYAMVDTATVTIDGYTTDVTRYIRIYTPPTERHAGIWDTGKYVLSVNSGFTNTINQKEDYVRLEGLQIENTSILAFRNVYVNVTANAASSDIRIDSCLVRNGCGGGGLGSVQCDTGLTTIRNSIIYKSGGTSHGVYGTFTGNAATVNVDNCVVAACGGYGFFRDSGTMTLRNCYSGGNATDAYSGTITRTTCAHDTATSFSNSTGSVPHSTATFVSVTAGSEDYHEAGGSALIGQGTDLSGTFTKDIDGVTRIAPWDIGADQFATSGNRRRRILLGAAA